MNFLVDAQRPPAPRWILGQGHHAAHVLQLGLEKADDHVIWERARDINAVIISAVLKRFKQELVLARQITHKNVTRPKRPSTAPNSFPKRLSFR